MGRATLLYYLYVSDAKVDMLFGQLPDKVLKEASIDLSVDLGPLKAGLKIGETASEDRRYKRLQLVVRALEESAEPIGELGDACKWVRTIGKFRWEMRGFGPNAFPVLTDIRGAVLPSAFFVGSAKHIIGRVPPGTHLYSAPPDAFTAFFNSTRDAMRADPEFDGQPLPSYSPSSPTAPPILVEFMAIAYARMGPTTIGSPLYVAVV